MSEVFSYFKSAVAALGFTEESDNTIAKDLDTSTEKIDQIQNILFPSTHKDKIPGIVTQVVVEESLCIITENEKIESDDTVENTNNQKQNNVTKSPIKVNPKQQKFNTLLNSSNVNMEELRKICWNGIPSEWRALCWKLLLGYMPLATERRDTTIAAKRKQYWECVQRYITSVSQSDRTEHEQKIFYQISIDVPRTSPEVHFFQLPKIQACLERILCVWAMRHPASGYVQGINDLVTPFIAVFLQPHIQTDIQNIQEDIDLPEEILNEAEADTYWCLTKFIDCIQDNFTDSQPGLQRMIFRLREIIQTIDTPLHRHFENQNIEYMQFAFRWMNCLLMRELPLRLVIRMWDTYLSEGESFSDLHVFLCAAFLNRWSKELQNSESNEMLIFLQKLPTTEWRTEDLETLLSLAYVWKTFYNDSPNHLKFTKK